MAADGPDEKDLPVSSVTDDEGNKYILQNKLGAGATAAVYSGMVVTTKSKGNRVGETVAIKIPFSMGLEPDIETVNNAKREEAILAKVGDLKGTATPKNHSENVTNTMIQSFIPGKMVTSFMYDDSQRDIVRKELSQTDKDNISYGLLREYAALQMLNIVHCDLKPDNMMYDPKTATLKIMDFGNAIDQTQSFRHDGLQGAGLNYLPDGARKTGNTNQVDLFAVGVIIASLYAERCYIAERNTRSDNDSPYEIMDDILGPDVEDKAGMPDDLFAIVRHLTHSDPDQRPENIALADGLEKSEILSDVYNAQVEAEKLRQGYIANANNKKVSQEVINVLESHKDLTAIRNAFAELQKNDNIDDVSKAYMATTIPVIDQITKSQAKSLQSAREREVHNEYQATNITNAESTIQVVEKLQSMANEHRVKTMKGLVTFSKQYDNVGIVINQSINELLNDKDYPKIEPDKMKKALEKLSGQIVTAAGKKLEKEHGTMQNLESLRDGLPDSSQRQSNQPRVN